MVSLAVTPTISPSHHQRRHQQQQNLLPMRRRAGGSFRQVIAFCVILALSCSFFSLATCGPCLENGMQISAEYHDACGSYGADSGLGFQDIVAADAGSGYAAGSSMTQKGIGSVCANSLSFCFPSTLPGFSSRELNIKSASLRDFRSQFDSLLSIESTQGNGEAGNRSWSSDNGIFGLINGRTVSCTLNTREGLDQLSSLQADRGNQNDLSSCRGTLLSQKSASFRLNQNSGISKPGPSNISSSPCVEISPAVLDWGQKHLYFPSTAFLTVANACNDSILHVYEPFSTNSQFYPCNSSNVSLGPGEVASICFVFLPRWLGLSLAHLILQTSSGGFLIHVRGYTMESPYEFDPLAILNAPSTRRLSKNLSLFNPFNETLYVEEASAWISVSQGNVSYHTEASCSLQSFWDSNGDTLPSLKDWLLVKDGHVGFPLMAMRPHENWEIGPQSSEIIVEIDFSLGSEGKIFGAFCLQLLRSTQDKADTVMVPLEVDLSGKVSYDSSAGSFTAYLEALVPYDGINAATVALSLRNNDPYLLRVIEITEAAATKVFEIKYIEGLLLFPGTTTLVASIACTELLVDLCNSPPEASNLNENCKLVILTNDSTSPQIEIPCEDVIHICLRHQKDSSIGYNNQLGSADSGSRKSESLSGSIQLPSHIRAMEMAEADEFILGNWKAQGTASGMSVLEGRELLFPKVQVGTSCSKWIMVKNPTGLPVLMQLVLNSGEIVDECQDTYESVQPQSSVSFVHTEFVAPSGYGFSIAKNALTEAYVQPYGEASIGPILFHPSYRCGWSSSALIRNNLSGVEWMSIRGSGGLLSVALLEGSEPVRSIEFNLSVPVPVNISALNLLFNMEEITYACSQPLSKELFVKNVGDVPLQVRSIEVSGKGCRLDGFMVHTCEGFSLEPGESTKLIVSYQADFSAAILYRDLELAVATGILVIPMKASIPPYAFSLCKKSVIWTRLEKFSAAIPLAASIMFLVLVCLFPQVIAFAWQDCGCKTESSSITKGKPSRMHHNQRNNKSLITTKIDGLLRSVGDDKSSKQSSIAIYPDSQDRAPEQGVAGEKGIPALEDNDQINILSFNQKEKTAPDVLEASQPYNLTVRIAKDKGRRRRKRKGVSSGLTGLEVSSSQSGNSTPSSPLSPITSVMPNCSWSPPPDMDPIEAGNPFTQVAAQRPTKIQVAKPAAKTIVFNSKISSNCHSDKSFSCSQEQASASKATSYKATLLPCAPFPYPGKAASSLISSPLSSQSSSPRLSSSTIAPHARAPGPNLDNQKAVKVEDKVGDEYTYNIWGNHFSGLHLVGAKDGRTVKNVARENNSSSFFVRGPQAIVTKSQQNPHTQAWRAAEPTEAKAERTELREMVMLTRETKPVEMFCSEPAIREDENNGISRRQ